MQVAILNCRYIAEEAGTHAVIHEKLTTALLELDKFNSTEIEDIEDLEAISMKATPKEKKKKFSLKNYCKLQLTSCPHKPLEFAAAIVRALGIRSSVDSNFFYEPDPVGLVSKPLFPNAENEENYENSYRIGEREQEILLHAALDSILIFKKFSKKRTRGILLSSC